MTTPTAQPATPAQQAAADFREEIRQQFTNTFLQFVSLQQEIGGLRNDIDQMREGLNHASQPAPVVNAETFTAVKIEREKRKGKYYYKMIGGQFSKHGITIWDEILEALDLDKVAYDEDDTHKLIPPLEVRFSSEEYTEETTGEIKHRRKVTGKA